MDSISGDQGPQSSGVHESGSTPLSRPRQCWDNAVAESFFATLKEELLYRTSWPTRVAAKRAIFEYVEVFYNRQRLHSALDNLSPVAYEAKQRDASMTQAASSMCQSGATPPAKLCSQASMMR